MNAVILIHLTSRFAARITIMHCPCLAGWTHMYGHESWLHACLSMMQQLLSCSEGLCPHDQLQKVLSWVTAYTNSTQTSSCLPAMSVMNLQCNIERSFFWNSQHIYMDNSCGRVCLLVSHMSIWEYTFVKYETEIQFLNAKSQSNE